MQATKTMKAVHLDSDVEALLNTDGRPARRQSIYCDDCGREKMAEIRDGKLVIVDRRHGRQHVAVVDVIGKDK